MPPGEQSLHEGPLVFPSLPPPSQWQELGSLCLPRAPGRPAPCPRLRLRSRARAGVRGWAWGPWSLATCSGGWDSRCWKLAAESSVHRALTPPTPTLGTSTPPSLGSPSRGSRCSCQMERKPASLPSGHPFPTLLWPGVMDRRTDASHKHLLAPSGLHGGSGQAERLSKPGDGGWPVVRIVAVAAVGTVTSCPRAPSFGPVHSLLSGHAASWRKAQPRVGPGGSRLAGPPTPRDVQGGRWDRVPHTHSRGVRGSALTVHRVPGSLTGHWGLLGGWVSAALTQGFPRAGSCARRTLPSSADSFLMDIINHTFENPALSQRTRTQSVNQYFKKCRTEEVGGFPRGGLGGASHPGQGLPPLFPCPSLPCRGPVHRRVTREEGARALSAPQTLAGRGPALGSGLPGWQEAAPVALQGPQGAGAGASAGGPASARP